MEESRQRSRIALRLLGSIVVMIAACSSDRSGTRSEGLTIRPDATLKVGAAQDGAWILPNARRIEPLGTLVTVDPLPLGLALSPDGGTLFATSGGRGRQSVTAISVASASMLGIFQAQALFLGVVVSPDGRTVYASGSDTVNGGQDVRHQIEVLGWDGTNLTPVRNIALAEFAGALALSPDGSVLYALGEASSGVTVIEAATGSILATAETGANPYGVALSRDGRRLYVSSERDGTVDSIDVHDPRAAKRVATVRVEKNPEGIALTPDGALLFVANADEDSVSIIDTNRLAVDRTVDLRTTVSQGYGTGPNALTVSPDGHRLYVAQAAENRIAVLDVPSQKVVGAIPTAWYPVALALSADGRHLYVSNAKGIGSLPFREQDVDLYDTGAVQLLEIPEDAALAEHAARIDEMNSRSAHLFDVDAASFHNPVPRERGGPTPIDHVFLVVRENKTYDSVLGDFAGGDGDPESCLFCGDPTPNLHALVARYASGDNYYSNAEASDQGHQILASGISNTYLEKIDFAPLREPGLSLYLEIFLSPAIYPKKEYLFQSLAAHDIPFRVYGEAVGMNPGGLFGKEIQSHFSLIDPPIFSTASKDIDKIDERIAAWERDGIPRFVYMLLPDDHTSGCVPPNPTPQSMVADNDLATGRFLDWLSHSSYWDTSVVFVVEDDPQQGRDHVDRHRSILLVASPWVKHGYVSHVQYHEGNLHATIQHLLGLPPLTIYDELAQPMWDLFTDTPDASSYEEVPRIVPDEMAMPGTNCAADSAGLNLVDADQAQALSEILWSYAHPEVEAVKPHAAPARGRHAGGPLSRQARPDPALSAIEFSLQPHAASLSFGVVPTSPLDRTPDEARAASVAPAGAGRMLGVRPGPSARQHGSQPARMRGGSTV